MTGRSVQFVPVYEKRDLGQPTSRELLLLFRCGCMTVICTLPVIHHIDEISW